MLSCLGGTVAGTARLLTDRTRATRPVLGASQALGLGAKRQARCGLGIVVNIRLGVTGREVKACATPVGCKAGAGVALIFRLKNLVGGFVLCLLLHTGGVAAASLGDVCLRPKPVCCITCWPNPRFDRHLPPLLKGRFLRS